MVSKIADYETLLKSKSFEADVTEHRIRVWAVLIALLEEFMSVCRQHNIGFFVDGGTMLGAIRHKGFIPWDDDIDLIMTRCEYEKLLLVANEFKHPYFLQTSFSEPQAVRGHAQLRNSDTTAILKSEMIDGRPRYTFNQGIFIDIFVLDNIPDNDIEAAAFMKKLSRLKRRMRRVKNAKYNPLKLKKDFWRSLRYKVKILIYDMFHSDDYLTHVTNAFDKMARKYADVETKRGSHLTFMPNPDKKYLIEKRIFEESKWVDFEFLKVPVPSLAEEYLTQIYGDWKTPVVGGSMHGDVFFDVDNSYRKYLSER
jgi:lipopolysaccharide cholinephosphotransferase